MRKIILLLLVGALIILVGLFEATNSRATHYFL